MAELRFEWDQKKNRENQRDHKVSFEADERTVKYFEALSEETGISYRTLINLYLRECAASRKRLAVQWKPAA